MGFAGVLEEIPRPLWIAALVLGFIWYWPIGLAILAYLIGGGRFGRHWGPGRWYNMPPGRNGGGSATRAGRRGMWGSCCWHRDAEPPPSGNAAFDEYRAETLRRLEEEQREFQAYLDRLRRARDKAEFDQFMDERRRGSGPTPA